MLKIVDRCGSQWSSRNLSLYDTTGMRLLSSWNSGRSSQNADRERRAPPKRMMNKNNPYRGHDYDPHREPRSPCGYFDGDQLYGMTPIRHAICSGRRDIKELLIQDESSASNKKDKLLEAELLKLAKEKGISIREFSKHDLNMLTENKAHQGFVLRVSPLELVRIECLEKSETFQCVLALDEIEDPQNFGALLRTSNYLGVERVVIRGKNSAPLSSAVSSISSGAVEYVTVNRVDSMVKFLEDSIKNGWQVIGTSLDEGSSELDTLSLSVPTILVLGNEGSGVRSSVLKKCTHLVKVSGAPYSLGSDEASVDSLNVSVTGGIILYHILKGKKNIQ